MAWDNADSSAPPQPPRPEREAGKEEEEEEGGESMDTTPPMQEVQDYKIFHYFVPGFNVSRYRLSCMLEHVKGRGHHVKQQRSKKWRERRKRRG